MSEVSGTLRFCIAEILSESARRLPEPIIWPVINFVSDLANWHFLRFSIRLADALLDREIIIYIPEMGL